MIEISREKNYLLLKYEPFKFTDPNWIDRELEAKAGEIRILHTFFLTKKDLDSDGVQIDFNDDREYTFKIGTLEGKYYKINKTILRLKHDLLISKEIKLTKRFFVAERNISVFRKIDELIDEAIIVGGEKENAIHPAEFERFLKIFPSTTEISHYAETRISRVLKDYFATMSDPEAKLNRYMAKKNSLKNNPSNQVLVAHELQKFQYIHDELSTMLTEADSYEEKTWQKKILAFVLFVFPKYIAVLENVRIKDFYTRLDKTTNRFVDLMLVDAKGSIDIIEVKKPFSHCIISSSKYRDNHTPRAELSGTIMQAEKYLFHLSKWGQAGEQEIYKKHKKELPEKFKLKITNPKALILIGRDDNFTSEQEFDFEIIRRKYANMIDIMTYDDLLCRLSNIIAMMKLKKLQVSRIKR